MLQHSKQGAVKKVNFFHSPLFLLLAKKVRLFSHPLYYAFSNTIKRRYFLNILRKRAMLPSA